MNILPSLSGWLSDSFDDLTVRENTPDGTRTLQLDKNSQPDEYTPTQSILSSILSPVDNVKRVVKRNVSDLFTDTDNALARTSDNINTEILAKEKLQDPTQWLSGGAGKVASAFVGAFRPSNSKLLPSLIARTKQELSGGRFNYEPPALLGKFSDKELSKYGTPEFLLDKYLPSTHEGGSPGWLKAKELPVSEFLETPEMVALSGYTILQKRVADTTLPMADINMVISRSANGMGTERMIPLEPDIRAFRDQITNREPIFTVGSPDSVFKGSRFDISSALRKIDSLTKQSSFTPEQLSKKSLNQLLGIADKVEKEVQKTEGTIKDFTVARTAELNKSQGLAPGFVELKTKADFGAETNYLKHCVGAGGVDQATSDFLPKWHPITGEEIIRNKGLQNSGEIYYGLSQKGAAKYISYRPEGIPVATAEIDKYGNIKQLMGFRNTNITGELRTKIEEGLQPAIKEMKARDKITGTRIPGEPPGWAEGLLNGE